MHKKLPGPLVLVVLDGVGETHTKLGNAVFLAPTPNWDTLKSKHKFTTLLAHGTAVGLPADTEMGNSEVGHNALGSGQIFDQGAKLVNDAITSKKIFKTSVWQTAINQGRQGNKALHFIGLLSDGNVHSHISHLMAMLIQASLEGVKKVRVHALLDGRDVGGTTAHVYVDQLEDLFLRLGKKGFDYRIASGGGRMKITMDRYEADWSMVEKGWNLQVHGQGRGFKDTQSAIKIFREENPGILDQDLPGFIIVDGREPVGKIKDGDSVIFFNFRGDRAMEISRAFEGGKDFGKFDRGNVPDVYYAGMMEYDGDTHCPKHYLVGPPNISNTLTDFLCENRIRQYAISETQKFGHITYFWNGNRSGIVDPTTETYKEIPSEIVPFDMKPWMKAVEITDNLIKAIKSGKFEFLRVNYANGDMVGHTGNLEASVVAMACLDLQLGRLMKAVQEANGVAIFTADHGNCEEMFELGENGHPSLNQSGEKNPKTSHTLNMVPFVIFDPHNNLNAVLREDPDLGLSNVTATVLEILGFKAPSFWQPSLLKEA